MTTAQRPAVKGNEGAKRGHWYDCTHPEPVWCRLQRNGLDRQKDYNFVSVLGGCDCPCHHTANGGEIPPRAWVPPGHKEPIGVLHAIRMEKIEETQEDESWLL